MAQNTAPTSGGSKGGSAPSGGSKGGGSSKSSGGTKTTTKMSKGSGNKNGVNAQAMPAHMHREEQGKLGIKAKWTGWPEFKEFK